MKALPYKILALCATFLSSVAPSKAVTQTQTLDLQIGWNAVWMDPSPVQTSGDSPGEAAIPEEVFNDPRITVVARPLLPVGSAEFVTDSSSVFNQEEWLVWYRNPQALVNTLGSITGNQAYYVKVEGGTTPISLPITGEVSFFTPDWVPASYNLLGFNLSSAISFGDFFGASGEAGGNHPISAILRIDPLTGNWTGVQNSDMMQPGEAYWIKAVRNSTFVGPVSISFDGLDGVDFGSGIPDLNVVDGGTTRLLSSAEITFTNVSEKAETLAMDLVDPLPADELKIYEVVPGNEALSHEMGPAGQISNWDIGNIASASTRTITLGAERSWSSGDAHRENLYRIDIGPQYFWLPASATNLDVEAGNPSSADPASAGLWVGEVVLNSVSQLGDETLSPAGSTAPVRLIIHSDANGNLALLGHVLFMQTKSADVSVPAESVLVIDEAKIPFFEGIETRNGKRVGRRIETIAYDLPRREDPATQASLLEEVVASNDTIDTADDVTDEDIALFLNRQTSRPPDLVESYHLSWPMEGALTAGSIIRTGDASPLILDPFHRSNPFRHAFHPQHGAGYTLTRSITISLDNKASSQGLLSGIYQETVTGLAKNPITARGAINLVRLSTVPELQ